VCCLCAVVHLRALMVRQAARLITNPPIMKPNMGKGEVLRGPLHISPGAAEADWYDNIALVTVVLENLEKFRILFNLGA
jgi:hypothetical protein